MDRQKIVEQLTGIFRKIFRDDNLVITDEMTANDVDSWDSLSHMLLITDIEDHFSIKFKLRELNKLRNVGALVAVLESKLN